MKHVANANYLSYGFVRAVAYIDIRQAFSHNIKRPQNEKMAGEYPEYSVQIGRASLEGISDTNRSESFLTSLSYP